MEKRAHAMDDKHALGLVPPPLPMTAPLLQLTGEKSEYRQPAGIVRGRYPVPVSAPENRLLPVRSPLVSKTSGRLVQLREIARDICEVTIAPSEPIKLFPGQYCLFAFAGFPRRKFSPTANLATIREDGYLRLHVKRIRGGRVTSQLGRTIKVGHRVEIEGPFGRGFIQPPSFARLVLIGSSTGFAPVWSIAAAALRAMPSRAIVLAGAAPALDAFYMAPALEIARKYPHVSIIATVDEIAEAWHGFVPGPPTAHLPPLSVDDVVYAAGSGELVGAIGQAAAAAGASFNADPLEPAAPCHEGWLQSARRWLTTG